MWILERSKIEMHTVVWGLSVIVLMNVITWLAFRNDKRRAEHDLWRIAESHLLILAFFGGSIGAFAAQQFYRHKTRKQPFRSRLNRILFLHLVLLLLLLTPETRVYLSALLKTRIE